MTIALSKRVQDWIEAEVAAGRFASETELVEEALREMMERAEIDRLRRRIAESQRQIERGELIVADDAFFETLRNRIRTVAAKNR
jgi:putative addiction module CopG family antidote